MIVSTMPSNNGGIGRADLSNFAQQVMVGRWLSLFGSFLVMVCSGGFYLYASFSKDIKEMLNCDQTTLNKIGFYKDLGSSIGILAGILAQFTPSWFLLILCSTVNFIGHFKIWQAVTGKIEQPTVDYFSFYIAVAGNSQILANTVVLVTSVKNFPERRGVVLGLLKGFLGLGGAILTQISLAIYGDDTKALILLLAWLPSLITLIFAFTIREVRVVKHPNEFRVFVQFLCCSVILAMFLTVLIFIEKWIEFEESAHIFGVAVIMGLLFVPFLISIREEIVQRKFEKVIKFVKSQPSPNLTALTSISSLSSPTLLQSNQKQKASSSFFANIFNKPERGEDYTILQAILSIDMLVLHITTIIGIGSSFTAMANLAQIGESHGYTPETINAFVSLASIFNFVGRIFSGFVSEILLEKYKFPRPLMLTLTLLVSCIGFLLVAFPFHYSLYIASTIVGFCLGSQIPLFFVMISEIFGLKNYSILSNFGQLSYPVGSYVLNVLVVGSLYDEAAKMEVNSIQSKCFGEHCYRTSFVILAAVTLLGAGISMILVRRTREFYRGDIYKKFREDMDSLKTEVELYPFHAKRKEVTDSVILHKKITDTSKR